AKVWNWAAVSALWSFTTSDVLAIAPPIFRVICRIIWRTFCRAIWRSTGLHGSARHNSDSARIYDPRLSGSCLWDRPFEGPLVRWLIGTIGFSIRRHQAPITVSV